MRNGIKLCYLVLITGIALLGLTAMSAAADPNDTTTEPTEDWVFDSGNVTVITGADWTMRYNITVTNESILTIQDSDLLFNSSDPYGPNWIFLNNGSLNILRSDLVADEGSNGFFIETHNVTKLSSSTFEGLAYNPNTGAGISIYETNATLEFVTINTTTWMTTGLWSLNSNVTIDHGYFMDIDSDGIVFRVGPEHINDTFELRIIDSEFSGTGDDAIAMPLHTSYSNAVINCYNVTIQDSGGEAIAIDHRNNGNGSVYATFDDVHIDTTGRFGLYLSCVYSISGISGQNVFNVTFVNSTLTNVSDAGFYVQMYFSPVDFNLIIENSHLENIALNPTGGRLSGVYFWNYYSTGSARFYGGNTTFKRCNPSAFQAPDMDAITEIRFFNCSMRESEGAGLEFGTDWSGTQPPITIENCTIEDNKGPGIHHLMSYYSKCQPIDIMNSSIARNGGPALQVDQYGSYAGGFGFNVTNTVIKDHDGPAVQMDHSAVDGNVYVLFTDCMITNTKGIMLNLADGSDDNPDIFVTLVNTTMADVGATAISVYGSAYRGSFDTFITLENSTLRDVFGTGIHVDVVKRYYYYNPGFTTNVMVLNSTMENITANGLFLTIQTPENKGSRNFTIINSEIYSTQRAIYTNYHDGEVWHSKFTDTLKEEIIGIGCKIDLFYCDFEAITDEKFKVYGFAKIRFTFDLVVFVRWDTGVGAMGASVEIMDNTQKLISVQTVKEEDGSVPVYTMIPYWVEPTGIYSSSPYVINVEFMDLTKTVGVRLNKNKEVYIILEDHIDPEIVMLYPDTGHVQQSVELEARGSAWDSQSGVVSVQISLDGENWIEADGEWIQWNITLEVSDELIQKFGGYFVLTAKAIDSAGNEAEDFAIIRVDPTPPELKIDFPLPGYITNNPRLYVRGVTELGSTVKVNGQVADLVVSMFNHPLDLMEGPNSITVVSIDPLGNIEFKTLEVTLDTQEPYLILISPEMDEITNEDEILMQAQVEAGLTVYINGFPIEYGSDHYPEGEGILVYAVSLEPGDNPIIIRAIDKAGNVLLVERDVVMDRTPPWISVAAPLDGERLARPEVNVKGTVEPGVQLFVMDENVETGNGFFERVILALEGENEILLKAIDPAGNEYIEVVTIFVDTVPPVLNITDPILPMLTVGERRFHINGTIGLDESGELADDRLLLNGYAFTTLYDETGTRVRVPIEIASDGTFSITVDLEQGRNDFTIEVLDSVGNVARVTRTVYLDAIAPTLVLYMDPVMRDETGEFYTHALTLNLTGYTNPGSELRVLGILVSVAPDGTFQINLDLVPEDLTDIVVTSTNTAGNTRTIEESVTQMKVEPASTDDEGLGSWFLITALVIFVVVALVAFMMVRSRREDYIEMQAAEETPLADLETTEHDIEIEGPGAGAVEVDELGKAPLRPRPRPSHPSRPVRPEPVTPEEPEMTEKDLTDQGAEADISADETDQEVE